jgi:hypothetical protein
VLAKEERDVKLRKVLIFGGKEKYEKFHFLIFTRPYLTIVKLLFILLSSFKGKKEEKRRQEE